MKIFKILAHIAIAAISLFLMVALPYLQSDYYKNKKNGTTDGISSASITLDKPSGDYVILINTNYHKDENKLAEWETFFTGGDYSYIFEDITCAVADNDTGAIELAKSYQSSISENQMTIKEENSTLLLSRADNGLYDIIIMSKEFAEANNAATAYKSYTKVIETKGKENA